jgi:Ca-activated chloride channel family protein
MKFMYPPMLGVAAVVCAGLVAGYVVLHRRRTRALAAAGLAATATGRMAGLRHVPPALFLAALAFLLLGVSRPQATVGIPQPTGTVVLAFDVSNSMKATDVDPTRLAVAQVAATDFVRRQPDTVDIGVVAFDQGAIATRQPTSDHAAALASINRLHIAGGTSLGQAILASLAAIVGRSVELPEPAAFADPAATPAPDLGYWGSASIIIFSDGEETGGPDAVAAAALAANAGIHIYTIGIGTTAGATIDVEGFQVATSLNEGLLKQIAATTSGTYRRAGDVGALDDVFRSLDLRISAKPQVMELTGIAVGAAVVLLTVGGMLMIGWFGRIL